MPDTLARLQEAIRAAMISTEEFGRCLNRMGYDVERNPTEAMVTVRDRVVGDSMRITDEAVIAARPLPPPVVRPTELQW